MAVPKLSTKTHVAKPSVLAEKAYQHEKARKEQAKRAHGAVLCEMPSTTANFQNSEQKRKVKLSEAFNRTTKSSEAFNRSSKTFSTSEAFNRSTKRSERISYLTYPLSINVV